jgi:hypothetical protein
MLLCVRTTIRLDDRLLRDLKKHAAARGRTLTAVVDEAVRQFLARTAAGEGRAKAPPFRVITFKGSLRPGVDLDDSSALLDLMEGTPAPGRR